MGHIMTKTLDVVTLCNALMDVMVDVSYDDLTKLELTKGIMHLVDGDRQEQLLDYLGDRSKHTQLGGSGMNTIKALAQLGAKTSFAGMIGQDAFGTAITEKLAHLGIEGNLQKHPTAATGVCLVMLPPDKDRTMNTHLGASCLYDDTMVPGEAITKAKVFHFCGYQWDTESQKQAIKKAIEVAKANGTLISFDVADPFVINRSPDDIKDIVMNHADIVFANREETQTLFKHNDPSETLTQLTAGGKYFVHKKDKDGADVYHKGEVHSVDAQPVTVADTTGAGDMFAAGFLYGISRGESPLASARMATVLAADTVQTLGAIVSDKAVAEAKALVSA